MIAYEPFTDANFESLCRNPPIIDNIRGATFSEALYLRLLLDSSIRLLYDIYEAKRRLLLNIMKGSSLKLTSSFCNKLNDIYEAKIRLLLSIMKGSSLKLTSSFCDNNLLN